MADPENTSPGIVVMLLLHAQMEQMEANVDILIHEGAVIEMYRKIRLSYEEDRSDEGDGAGKAILESKINKS